MNNNDSDKLVNTFKVGSRHNTKDDSSRSDSIDGNKLGVIYWLCVVILCFSLFQLSMKLQNSCDFEKDFNINIQEKPDRDVEPFFNDTLARLHLKYISKLGRRPAGSIANEVHTPGYILKYLKDLNESFMKLKDRNIEMEIDEQIAKLNSFPLVLFGKFHITSVYDRIRNIVVRLHDNNFNSKHIRSSAVLINCHYDSYFDGPGASDDLVSCAVLLENIRSILAAQPINLKHDLIFLFNGAEENMMQASHAFVSQHRWAADVKLFVNLEAAGSGGRQMIFQASPKHPWIIDEVAAVIRQPLANIIGQEVFSANLIPSDTDFRIFRDFGHLPGLDLAFVANGYVYHTRFDTEDRIPQACLRHTGTNLLRLGLRLANSRKLDPYIHHTDSQDEVQERVVFFDLLGLRLVSYSERTGVLANLSLVLVVFVILLVHAHTSGSSGSHWATLARATFSALCWMLSSIALAVLWGFVLHRLDLGLAWYGNRYHVVGLYLAPVVAYFLLWYRPPRDTTVTLDASLLLLAVFTVALTAVRLLSVYLISSLLLALLLHTLLLALLRLCGLARLDASVIYFLVDTTTLSLPLAHYFCLVNLVYDFFIPVFGRTGPPPPPPDCVIGGLTAAAAALPGLLLAPALAHTLPSSRRRLLLLAVNSSIAYCLFLAASSNMSGQIGFPYGGTSETGPRHQRVVLNHVTRNLRGLSGHIETSESGIWMIGLDANQMRPLRNHLEKVIREPLLDVFCELRPYCGYPLLFPVSRLVDGSVWLTTRPPPATLLRPAASVLPLSKVGHISGMVNLTLQVTGPSHSHLFLMTPASMRLVSWSLGPDPPQPIAMPNYGGADANSHRHYFVYNAYGVRPPKPLQLWITFLPSPDAPRDSTEFQIEIAVSAHYLLADTPELETMLHLMPNWVAPSTLASSYEHIVVDFSRDLTYNQ